MAVDEKSGECDRADEIKRALTGADNLSRKELIAMILDRKNPLSDPTHDSVGSSRPDTVNFNSSCSFHRYQFSLGGGLRRNRRCRIASAGVSNPLGLNRISPEDFQSHNRNTPELSKKKASKVTVNLDKSQSSAELVQKEGNTSENMSTSLATHSSQKGVLEEEMSEAENLEAQGSTNMSKTHKTHFCEDRRQEMI